MKGILSYLTRRKDAKETRVFNTENEGDRPLKTLHSGDIKPEIKKFIPEGTVLRDPLYNPKEEIEPKKNDYDIQDGDGKTPLIRACEGKNYNYAEELLTVSKVDPNIQDSHGYTALMIACENENMDLVKLLLENNANPDRQDSRSHGYTTLMIACEKNNIELVKLLLRYDATIGVLAYDNVTSAFTIAKKTNSSIARLLDPQNKKGVLPNFLVDAIPFQLPYFGGKRRTHKYYGKKRNKTRKSHRKQKKTIRILRKTKTRKP